MVNVKGYKDYVLSLVPSLTVLDGLNKNGEEVFSEVSDEEWASDEGDEEDSDN